MLYRLEPARCSTRLPTALACALGLHQRSPSSSASRQALIWPGKSCTSLVRAMCSTVDSSVRSMIVTGVNDKLETQVTFQPTQFTPRFTGGHKQTLYAWARPRRFPRLPPPAVRYFDVAADA